MTTEEWVHKMNEMIEQEKSPFARRQIIKIIKGVEFEMKRFRP